MRWPVRVILLFVGAFLAMGITMWIGTLWGPFKFADKVSVFPIFQVGILSTVFGWMFPGAYWAANAGKWDDQPEVSIFLASSMFLIPLILVFPPPDALYEAFMSRSEFLAPFFGVWFMHCAINAWHVHILKGSVDD